MKKIFTKEVKIAVVAIAAIVAVFFGMNFLKGLTIFSNTTTYKMAFKDVKGLSRNTAVYADGYKVGTVSDIIYNYEGTSPITVEVDLDPNLRIPAGSKATIESDLMGNIKVSLLLATNPRERIPEGGTIEGIDDNGIMGQAAALMPQVEAMIPKIDSILTSVNMLLANPAIVSMLQNTEAMSANLKSTTSELNGVMAGLNRTLPSMMDHANNTLANTEALTNNLSKVDLDETMGKVNRTLANVEEMTKALNDKQGTIGKLMYDPSVYNNLNSTMSHADSLMIDLQSHPKRYVHFSIFGKKDK